MLKANILAIPFVLVITSFYFFPTVFTFLPMANTKMLVAACGLVTFMVRLGTGQSGRLNKDFFLLSLCALAVSFASFLTMTINNTPDDSYLSYIVSMWVWLVGAYFVVSVIRQIHGKVSVELVCFYLIGVGVMQCVLAVMMEQIPPMKEAIDSVLADDGFMGRGRGRMHGIGCALDVAGGRFAVLLVMVAFLLPRMLHRERKGWLTALLLFSMCVLCVIGNMIGRTTTMGAAIALAYLLYAITFGRDSSSDEKKYLARWFVAFLVVVVSASVYLYNTSDYWREEFRFGFEGFFSLVEKGRWETTSTSMLQEGFIYPDNLRCWVIGDGHMASTDIDPYYQGEAYHGFYKGVDAGYSRFLFYFGLVGLAAFSLFILKAGEICIRRFSPYTLMFLMILALNFIVWVKVSTDIFLCFAPFLALQAEDEEEYNKLLEA